MREIVEQMLDGMVLLGKHPKNKRLSARVTEEEYNMAMEMGDEFDLSEVIRLVIRRFYANFNTKQCRTNVPTPKTVKLENVEQMSDTSNVEQMSDTITPEQEEMIAKNKKLYGEYLKKLRRYEKDGGLKLIKDPSSNGITKYDIINKNNMMLKFWIYKIQPNEFPKGVYPVFLDSSNVDIDEEYLTPFIKGNEENDEWSIKNISHLLTSVQVNE